jgi:hypothetical protein
VHNPEWAYLVSCDGAIPVYSFSSELRVLEQTLLAKTSGDVTLVTVPEGKNLGTAMNEFIHPSEHFKYGQFAMTASQRYEFARARDIVLCGIEL